MKLCIFGDGVKAARGLVRHLPVAAIACALLIRALVPTGWMPVFDRNGTVRLALCADAGAHPKIAMAHSTRHESGGSHRTPPCEFSVLALGYFNPPSIFLPLRIDAGYETAVLTISEIGIGRGLAAPPPPSTGPPILN